MDRELDFGSKKEQLLELEKNAKRRIQESSEVVKHDALQALKIALTVGGVLFVGYKITRAFTSSGKNDEQEQDVRHRPAKDVSRLYNEAQNEPHPTKKGGSILKAVMKRTSPMISGVLLQLAMDAVQKNFLKHDPSSDSTRAKK